MKPWGAVRMNKAKERELFENCGVTEAIFRLAFPTVIGQIILVIYNMADTFFVGLTGNDAMIAAVTVCMPAFMFLSAVPNLFGVGGASVISRAMGSGDTDRVHATASFSFWGCLFVSLLYGAFTFVFLNPFVDLLGGTDPIVHENAVAYMTCTVVLGGAVTAMSVLLSHLIRSEGRAVYASVGIALGGVANIALDPLFMFVVLPAGNEALGAAIATTLANLISLLYFVIVLRRIHGETNLSFRFSTAIIEDRIPAQVLSAGAPACIMTLFENISYAVLDKLMSLSGLAMQAGVGVAKKVNMLAHCIARGVAQGSLPLIGYSFASKNWDRMRASVRVSHWVSVGMAAICMAVNLAFAKPLIGIFIHQSSPSLAYGAAFLRILCIGGPFSASAYTLISFFQATGEGTKSFLLAILRKGLVDIPLMFLLNGILPIYGIVLATPIADALCCMVANNMFSCYLKNLLGSSERTFRLPTEGGTGYGRYTVAVAHKNS